MFILIYFVKYMGAFATIFLSTSTKGGAGKMSDPLDVKWDSVHRTESPCPVLCGNVDARGFWTLQSRNCAGCDVFFFFSGLASLRVTKFFLPNSLLSKSLMLANHQSTTVLSSNSITLKITFLRLIGPKLIMCVPFLFWASPPVPQEYACEMFWANKMQER